MIAYRPVFQPAGNISLINQLLGFGLSQGWGVLIQRPER
jgi:hypothetical protein